MVYHYEYSTYSSHHKVFVNLQASNTDALKNQNYGLCWPTLSDLLSLKEYSTTIWATAQHDGRPAKRKWRPLFNGAKFG